MSKIDINEVKILLKIQELIVECGGSAGSVESELIVQQIHTALRLLSEGHNIGQIKLITRALKELRYAYRIFNDHPATRRISIFGSARTPEEHPDYLMARDFSIELAKLHWICITGAANGIMKAGMAGSVEAGGAFGLSIRLPFEVPTNAFIEGDPKLIYFRYFFTRKLMFMSHSDAIAVFPGGFGTMDELFEMLTLIQTGRSNIVPVVLMEGSGGVYWRHWVHYVEKHLWGNGWICPEDRSFYYIAPSLDDAVQHILQFYHRYHSGRYVKEHYVIRLQSALTNEQINHLNQKYGKLLAEGEFFQSEALPEEKEFLELPRLVFHHTRKDFGLLRQMIDTINEFD